MSGWISLSVGEDGTILNRHLICWERLLVPLALIAYGILFVLKYFSKFSLIMRFLKVLLKGPA